ncbi:AI-2E family transporter [Pleurocapsales cyanobacterium LEGE 06147]|nr:AI-2E family transporter [Pleurocapsales cyanobacterium LEGE 06147]
MNDIPKKKFWIQLNNSQLLRYLLLIVLGWAIAQILAYFETVIVIFIFAAILAFLLNYPVKWLQRFLPRTFAVILVVLLTFFILGVLTITLGFTILSQGQQLLDQLPLLLEVLYTLGERVENLLARWNVDLDLEAIQEELRNQVLSGITIGLGIIPNLLTNLIDLLLIVIVAFFMLLDGKRIWHFVLKVFPQNIRKDVATAIQQNFLGFFWGRFLLSVFFGVSIFLVFLILDLPYPLVLAAIGGVFDLIPGIGATLGITLVCLIVLPQGIWLSLIVLVSCIALQQVEENLLMPRIMQGSLNINPVALFFALLVGVTVAGLVGVFISIPIAGVIISLFELDEMKAGK